MKEKQHILIVEDDRLVADDEAGFLKKKGFDITIAGSGEQAIEIVMSGKRIDLILMDVDLGSGLNGAETSKKILKEKNLPILFLSGHADSNIVEKTEEITSFGYVLKNSGDAVLFASINMAFNLYEARTGMQKALADRERAEEELRQANDQLIAANEEYEATNEELTSTNEELEAANEELIQSHTAIMEHETALRESRERLAEAQALAKIGSWDMDLATGEAVWSDEYYRLVGCDPAEGTPPFPKFIEMIHPEDLPFFLENHDRVADGGEVPSTIEFRSNPVRGQIRYFNAIINSEKNPQGKVVRLFGTIQDVTGRKIAEKALRESEANLAEAQALARIGSWELDATTLENRWSAELFRLMDYDPAKEVPHMSELINIIHPDDLSLFPKYNEMLRNGNLLDNMKNFDDQDPIWNRPFTMEFRSNPQLGPVKYFNTIIHAVRNAEGKVVKLFGIVQDITESKLIEEEKRNLEARLTQAQKMESIGKLAGGIAHDFNNILSAIIGYAELALINISNTFKVEDDLKEILAASNRAKELVTQILAFSRKSETKVIPLALHSVIRESLKMLRSIIPANVLIKENIINEGVVLADSSRIHQVMMNLCTNSAHAMDEKGGVLDVAMERVIIDRGSSKPDLLLPDGIYLRLSIRDNGRGMPQDILSRMFEPYFTTKEIGRGTGLGLSVVHGIVKNYGGAITCASVPGKGTTFDVYLPEYHADIASLDVSETRPMKAGNGRILFVDDERALTELAEKVLVRLGYEVVTENDSVAALKKFSEDPYQFDLVITDMTMPAMTGDRLAGEIMDIRGDIPIILCTGYNERINENSAKKIGIREFITKPFDVRNLSDAIRRLIEKK